DIDLLEAVPYIMAGAQRVKIKGKLENVIVNPHGEVLALVLRDVSSDALMNVGSSVTSASVPPSGTTSSGVTSPPTMGAIATTNVSGMMGSRVLVRVPADMRHGGMVGNPRVADLKNGSDVMATGLPEAPLYGMVSSYQGRLIADTITVDGRSVGVSGFPRMMERNVSMLFGGK